MAARTKVSATLTRERLREAQAITGESNVSHLLDEALGALIERELENRWLAANLDNGLPGDVEIDLRSVLWEQ